MRSALHGIIVTVPGKYYMTDNSLKFIGSFYALILHPHLLTRRSYGECVKVLRFSYQRAQLFIIPTLWINFRTYLFSEKKIFSDTTLISFKSCALKDNGKRES